MLGGVLTDLARPRSELIAENALLRQRLLILRRQVKRPMCTKTDRLLLLLARADCCWKQALFLVQPDTLLDWHRQAFRVGVTRHPTNAWVAQQVREATPFGQSSRFLICDHDAKFGSRFVQVASGTGIKFLRTPIQAPSTNTFCERFDGERAP